MWMTSNINPRGSWEFAAAPRSYFGELSCGFYCQQLRTATTKIDAVTGRRSVLLTGEMVTEPLCAFIYDREFSVNLSPTCSHVMKFSRMARVAGQTRLPENGESRDRMGAAESVSLNRGF